MATLLSVNEVKLLLMETHHGFMDRLVVMDTSGRNTRGFSYAIVRASWHNEYSYWVRDEENPLVSSTTEHLRDAKNKMGGYGAFREAFNEEEVEAVVANFKVKIE